MLALSLTSGQGYSCKSTKLPSVHRSDSALNYSARRVLSDRFLPEFRLSAIPDRLALANVRWIEGDEAIEILTEEAISKVQKVTSYASEPAKRILERYKFAAAGGWVAYGSSLDGSPGMVPYFKGISPRQSNEPRGFGQSPKIKTVKYETPQGMEAAPILPRVDKETASEIYKKYRCTQELNETFWQVVKRCSLPIAITEGLKKALCLIGQGIPAIGIRGITQWRIKGTDELHPTISDFATKGREIFIVFDQDDKKTTQKAVKTQILKLGSALTTSRTECRVALWNQETGKGIDDAVYALKGGTSAWVEAVFEDAPTIKEFKKDSWILEAQSKIAHLNTLSYPIARNTIGSDADGGYMPKLPDLKRGVITVIDASMNAGKTTRIGEDYVRPWINDGGNVLVLTPINNLGKQAASDWGLPHKHDNTNDRWGQGGIVMCGESLHSIPDQFFEKPVLLILDEANQIIEGLVSGETLGDRYSEIMEKLQAVSRLCMKSGAIVMSEDGIPNRSIDFLKTISGGQTVEVIRHKKTTPWDVKLFQGQASGFRSMFLEAARTDRVLYVTTSQREGERIERAMKKIAPDRKVFRIDSKTNEGGLFSSFFKNPDQWIQENQPDILILSPSAKSGVSIEGGKVVSEAYFSAVWGHFSSLATDTHMQLLGRYRPAVPRLIYCPQVLMTNGDESLLNPRTIKRRLGLNAKTIAGVYDCAELLDLDLDSDSEAVGSKLILESAILECLATSKAVSGLQKSIAHVALSDRLKKSGHNVRSETLANDKVMGRMFDRINVEIWTDEATVIAQSEIGYKDTIESAKQSLNGTDTKLEDRIKAQKIIWRSEFPGVMFDCPKECYSALCENYGAMARGVKLQARSENVEDGGRDDEAMTRKILGDDIRALHRLPKSQVKAKIIALTGVLSLTDGTPYSNDDDRCQKVKEFCLSIRKEIRYWLGLDVQEDQTAISICHKLLRKFGLNRDQSHRIDKETGGEGRSGAIKTVDRKGKRGATVERFRIDLDYDPIRTRLLEAARRKLSTPVVLISNIKEDLIEINTTPQTRERRLTESPMELDESFSYEYIPSPEELEEWGLVA